MAMKLIDQNFLKYDKLFRNTYYKYVYIKSKKFECLLPENVKLGDMFLYTDKNDSNCQLINILIGCKEYNIKLHNEFLHKSLYLFFHSIKTFENQFVTNDILSDFDKTTGKYIGSEKISNIFNNADIYSKLIPRDSTLEILYYNSDYIEVPF